MSAKKTLGRCLHCRKPKKAPGSYQVPRIHYAEDPYCTRKCCEANLGIESNTGSMRMYAKAV